MTSIFPIRNLRAECPYESVVKFRQVRLTISSDCGASDCGASHLLYDSRQARQVERSQEVHGVPVNLHTDRKASNPSTSPTGYHKASDS